MIRSFQWDLARQVERLDWLLEQLPKYADWGYQELHLHLEDAVEFPSLPTVARRDAYSRKQFALLVETAHRAGIRVVPIVNLLGHTQYLIKTAELRDLNELRASDGSPLEHGQICPLHPRTMDVAEKLLHDMKPFCTAGKVHVGLDESFDLGKHPLSKKEIETVGLGGHFARYVGRLHALVGSLGLDMGMWGDMLYFIPDAIPKLPKGITVYEWYYHAFKRRPKVELFNFAERDIATPLRAHGIELYGCPMNGAFRYEPLPHFRDRMENIIAWWRHCQRVSATGFLISSWEPFRLAVELTTAVDAAAASLWLEPEITDPREMLERGFERMFGRAGRKAARIALAADQYPFSGYPRWEINRCWDIVSRRESLTQYRREELHFATLTRKAAAQKLPVALRASLQFRHHLAVRDVSVRQLSRTKNARGAADQLRARPDAVTQHASKKLGAALRAGQRAARVMWNRTRDPNVTAPNETIVLADAARLKAFLHGKRVFGGRWQLCYRVWNFAPAAQLVGIEQRDDAGRWQIKQSCHTIEFQTAAAGRRGDFVRAHAAPVEWSGDERTPPVVRLFVSGIGEVKVGDVVLTDGRIVIRASGFGDGIWRRIGRPAPASGLPEMNGASSTKVLHFRTVSGGVDKSFERKKAGDAKPPA